MKNIHVSRWWRIFGAVCGLIVWLANSSNPPTGLTGAPFDNGTCNNCHGGGSYSGTVSISGLPSTIEPNTTYPMEITLTATSGNPSRGGYQLVVVDGNNNNAGDLITVNGQSGTEFFNGREYIEHRGSKVFSGGTASWAFNWKSPASAAGNTIKFYFIGNFCNGNGNTSGDIAFAFSETYAFAGAPPLTVSISDVSHVSCFGGSNGSATAEASGGAPPYTYLWSNGQNGPTAVNLSAGTYTVTVTGSAGSGTATASVTITQPPVLNVSVSVSNVITCLNPTATLTASVSGGVPPYSYQWSNGDFGNPIQVSSPGVYAVVVTDANGCTKSAQVTVSANVVAPVANAGPPAVLTCAQPLATLNGAGSSTGPIFSYQWTASNGGNIVSGANTLNPVVNAAGTYTLVVTNTNNGCTSSAATTATSNQQPPTANASGGIITCVDPEVTVQVTTNAASPVFLWSGPGGFSSDQSSFETSVAGMYAVTVTNSANGCTSTANTQVTTDTLPPTIAIQTDTLTCSDTVVVLLTTTNADSAAFAWSGPGGFSSSQRNPSVSLPGSYAVTVTEVSSGCTNTAAGQVAQDTISPTVSVTAEPITCSDTLAQLTLTTNADSAAFAWSGPSGFSATQQNPQVSEPGEYMVVVTRLSNGCTASALATVALDTAAPLISIAPPLPLNCFNDTISLDASASAQGQQFSYLWTTPDGHIISGDTTLTPLVDSAGTYILTIANTLNGCSSIDTAVVVQSPPVAVAVVDITPVTCFGQQNGSATAVGSGGVGSLTYAWSNGDTTAVTSHLGAGTYFVTVVDSEGCSAIDSAVIVEPPLLQANASATGETSFGANDGTATSAPTGGTVPYAFLWSTGDTTAAIIGLTPGVYTVLVQDANGCTAEQVVTVNGFNCTLTATISATPVTCFGANDGTATVTVADGTPPYTYIWSSGDSTSTAVGLAPGIYTATVTDAFNCPYVLSVQVISPSALQPNASATAETGLNRNDGTASAAPVGGMAPYAYLWSTGDTIASLSGLAPGIYTVTVTDANGCSAAQTVIVNAFNCTLAVNVAATPVPCPGTFSGSASATPVNGNAPFGYLWSNGGTTAAITNLPAGVYTVTVSDATDCQAVGTVVVTQPDDPRIFVDVTPASCPESEDGSITITVVSGATPPFAFTWPGGAPNRVGVGTHIVTITDANGCTYLVTVTMTSNDTLPPGLSCPPNTVACAGEPVHYTLPTAVDNCALGNAQPVLVQGLPSGSAFPVGQTLQIFELRDASGNTATCAFSVEVGPPIELTLDTVVNDVGGAGVGRIEISAAGGVGDIRYEWTKDGQPFATTPDLANLNAGTYALTATDANGCSRTLGPIVVDNIVSTAEPHATRLLRVWPNPASDLLWWEIRGTLPLLWQLFDASGRLVRQETFSGFEPIPVAHLPAGRYYLRILDAQGRSQWTTWTKQ